MTRRRTPTRSPRTGPAGRRAPASARSRGPRGTTSARRGRGRRTGGGDWPYQLGLVVLVVLLAALALGPLEEYSVAADRVDGLRAQRAELTSEVQRLEDREEALSDLGAIELLARREHGLVRPGERPFVVVTPEEELTVGPDAEAAPPADAPWYRRVGRALTDVFRSP